MSRKILPREAHRVFYAAGSPCFLYLSLSVFAFAVGVAVAFPSFASRVTTDFLRTLNQAVCVVASGNHDSM